MKRRGTIFTCDASNCGVSRVGENDGRDVEGIIGTASEDEAADKAWEDADTYLARALGYTDHVEDGIVYAEGSLDGQGADEVTEKTQEN